MTSESSAAAPTPVGPPVSVTSLRLEGYPEDDSYVFPGVIALSTAKLRALNGVYSQHDRGSYDAWIRQLGRPAYVDVLMANVILSNNRLYPVRITNVGVVAQCSAPADGTLFYSPSAGANGTVSIGLDLDRPHPVAREYRVLDGLGADYFATHTIAVPAGQEQPILIAALTKHHYCQYRLKVSVLDGRTASTVTVDDDGSPFLVTASLVRTDGYPDPHIYNRYHSLYLGGVASPHPDVAGFVPADPKTAEG